MAITSVYTHICGAISLRETDYDEQFEYCRSFEVYMRESGGFSRFAYVLHNADVNKKGEAETPHIQFWCRQVGKKRLGTIINEISVALNVNSFAVQLIKGRRDKDLDVRYLCHLDDKDKFQYPLEQLHTNLPQDYIELVMSEAWLPDEQSKVSFEKIYDVVQASNGSSTYIVDKLGLDVYMHYRWAILDIKKEMFGEAYKRFRKPPNEKKTEVN